MTQNIHSVERGMDLMHEVMLEWCESEKDHQPEDIITGAMAVLLGSAIGNMADSCEIFHMISHALFMGQKMNEEESSHD